MSNMIDLIPYLPREAVIRRKPRRQFFHSFALILESIVTLCIGAGFLLFLVAVVAVI